MAPAYGAMLRPHRAPNLPIYGPHLGLRPVEFIREEASRVQFGRPHQQMFDQIRETASRRSIFTRAKFGNWEIPALGRCQRTWEGLTPSCYRPAQHRTAGSRHRAHRGTGVQDGHGWSGPAAMRRSAWGGACKTKPATSHAGGQLSILTNGGRAYLSAARTKRANPTPCPAWCVRGECHPWRCASFQPSPNIASRRTGGLYETRASKPRARCGRPRST